MPLLTRAPPAGSPIPDNMSDGTSSSGRDPPVNTPSDSGGDNYLTVTSDTEVLASGEDIVATLHLAGDDNAVSRDGNKTNASSAQTITILP